MVRGLRWCADRLFREKFLHRALLLKLIAPAPGSGGSSAEHWRCTLRGSSSLSGANDVVCGAPAPGSTSSATDNSAPLSSSSSGAPPAGHSVTISQPLFTEDIRRILFHWNDNQLMHMHIVMTLTKTSFMERLVLQVVQACMYAAFVVIFSCSRRFGFRLCGYLLEESTVILTHMVNDIDMEKIRADVVEVPQVATRYWGVDKKGMRPFVAAAPTPPPPTSSAATQHHAEVGAPNATSDVSQPLQRTVTGNDFISTSPENVARAAFPEAGSPQPSETLVETAETVFFLAWIRKGCVRLWLQYLHHHPQHHPR
ncbi:alternative oxidase, putative [Bodo saltans]|uniref:Alternative oxidase n=1 Tax=Bodo saltans TaxID=75058 RepID=A0A0S4JGT8_BODSA|nr:alternative oxidase, putative [Bodo saltans]|eukprot:CUG88206.1 alternative oxidase, putative [Bodo saltans]